MATSTLSNTEIPSTIHLQTAYPSSVVKNSTSLPSSPKTTTFLLATSVDTPTRVSEAVSSTNNHTHFLTHQTSITGESCKLMHENDGQNIANSRHFNTNGVHTSSLIYSETSSITSTSTSNNVIQVMCEVPVSIQTSNITLQPLSHSGETHTIPNSNGTQNSGSALQTINDVTSTIMMEPRLIPVLLPTQHFAATVGKPSSSEIADQTESLPVNSNHDHRSITPTSSTATSSCTQSSKSKRIGRPRKDVVEKLKAEGESSNSEMKCLVCKRVFPRIKSLEAHMRIHTGEKPYQCDFPHCDRSFNQGGQLRTHHRLHTGEKPFKCSIESCINRYAHANRSCPYHINSTLQRVPMKSIEAEIDGFPNKDEVARWLYRYGRDHKIEVDILRYDNPAIKAEVWAELVVLKKPETEQIDDSSSYKRPMSIMNKDKTTNIQAKKRRTSGKSSEIQGALALMELAGN